jgi:hypothetical protein
VLDAIAKSESTKHVTWVFTDSQSSEEVWAAPKDYAAAATARGSPFVSIILTCDVDENITRLTNPSRSGPKTKLTDVDILREIRETEDIMRFGGELELEIDVTTKEPSAVAEEIKAFLAHVVR